jgi:hypothetical protein
MLSDLLEQCAVGVMGTHRELAQGSYGVANVRAAYDIGIHEFPKEAVIALETRSAALGVPSNGPTSLYIEVTVSTGSGLLWHSLPSAEGVIQLWVFRICSIYVEEMVIVSLY